MKNETQNKGNLGTLKAQLDLYQKGFVVLVPSGEHYPFDLVAYKEGSFKRIQVKYRKLNKYGSVEIPFRSVWSNKSGAHINFIDKKEIDLFCIYCPETDKCYYFNPNLFENKSSVFFSLKYPEKGRKEGIRLLKDFEEIG